MQDLWVLGGDLRSARSCEQLRRNFPRVFSFGVPEQTDEPLPPSFDCVVLPFPSVCGALLRGTAAIPVEEVLHRVHGGTQVFGGLLGIWREAMEARGATVYDLYGTEPMATANCVPTAEGAIALAITHSEITLHGARCLVLGYGRVGKVLAARLKALECAVTVGVRKQSDLALAEAFGLETDETGVYRHGLRQYDFVFNTVPARVFSREQLAALSPDCLLLELASAQAGINETDCQSLGLSYLFAPSLPARFAPKTSGVLYARGITAILRREAEK